VQIISGFNAGRMARAARRDWNRCLGSGDPRPARRSYSMSPVLMRSAPRLPGLPGDPSRLRIAGRTPDVQLKIGMVVGSGLT
jgi:hypothetical protein